MPKQFKHSPGAVDAPVGLRVAGPKGLGKSKVDREQKIISAVSVITRGEALGHRLWIDTSFLNQVVKAGSEKENGLKSRFTHPGLSSDGMGNQVGRFKSFRRRGDQVFADLHLFENSNQDKVNEILNLAEEAPDLFGTSIVFERDRDSEVKFEEKNSRKEKGQDFFVSPDEENVNNFTHARLAVLDANDVVDEPAANPGGLFSALPGSELATAAESVFDYIFAQDAADENQLNILKELGVPHPERIKRFMNDYLDRHGLEVVAQGEGVESDQEEINKKFEMRFQNIENDLEILQRSTKS